jgi:hypothetical protein
VQVLRRFIRMATFLAVVLSVPVERAQAQQGQSQLQEEEAGICDWFCHRLYIADGEVHYPAGWACQRDINNGQPPAYRGNVCVATTSSCFAICTWDLVGPMLWMSDGGDQRVAMMPGSCARGESTMAVIGSVEPGGGLIHDGTTWRKVE